jgi:hypothetical protein
VSGQVFRPSSTVYGLELDRDVSIGVRGVITGPDVTPRGNVALRAGQEVEPGGRRGWYQSAYVVLTPTEARELAAQLLEAVGPVTP